MFETRADSPGAYTGMHEAPSGQVAGVRHWRWAAERRPEKAVLHAKLLVDGRRALIGSATSPTALHANLEARVLIKDTALADDLEAHVGGLMT